MSEELRFWHHQGRSSNSSSSSWGRRRFKGRRSKWRSSSSSRKRASSKVGGDEVSRCSIRRWCSQLEEDLEVEEAVVVPTMKPHEGFTAEELF